MAVYKCKMCGGDLSITADVNIVECEYCGTTQTVPTADNEKKVNLFNRANRLRINSEFDKAASIYENIIAEFPEEAEAYWGLCLCNYGIEYVDDPATAKKVPTCHRASFEKLVSDENFELAMEYADVAAQKVYRDEAREIDRIMNDILSISRNEKPYDVFICYKETDEKGERTIDSVLAQDVYDALTAKGMKVFFSRISLEDKLGQMYEPYIFAALNSAKVLLCVGTKYEHFHAVWVKNEWSRFLKLMAKDKTKVLIPCYKDMDAYDLPDEFRALQAQDMGKIGFMQDLVRGVSKIFSSTEQSTPKQTVTQDAAPQTNSNIKQLMINGDTMYTGEVFADVPHGNGRAEYKNGNVYEGEWNRGVRNGTGILTSDDSVYEGQWRDDKENGQGKLKWNAGGEFIGEFRNGAPWIGNGVVYTVQNNFNVRFEGEYKNGERNGNGRAEYEDCVYEGQWKDNAEHGQGKLTWNGGDEFVGEFRNGKMWNGKGKAETREKGIFEGLVVDGVRKGKMVWNDGGEFVGEFREDEPWNGNGTVHVIDGYGEKCCHVGEFRNGKLWNGKGTVYLIENNKKYCYVGELKDGKRNGYGKMAFEDYVYEGQWKMDVIFGQGRMIWRAGGEFAGEFFKGQPWSGTGVVYVKDNKATYRYEGELLFGQMNGNGIITWQTGEKWSGTFSYGAPKDGSGIYYFGQERYEGEIKNGKRASRFFGFKRF